MAASASVILWASTSAPAQPTPAAARSGGPKQVKPHAPEKSVFGPASAWRLKVRSAPVAEDSPALVGTLAKQVADHWGGNAAFNVGQYAISTYTVRKSTRRHKVHWDNCQGKSYLPGQLYDREFGAMFRSVPIPRNAVTSPGNDSHLAVYDRSSDQLWEFWKARKAADGWHACWGGRIDDVSTSPGYFPHGAGASATGLSLLGGAVTIEDVRRGRIDHAMSLNVIDAAHWSDFVYPAQRSDGNLALGTPGAIQEGRRFRLDPSVDVDSLGLTPVAAMVARAAKKYGFIVNDKGGAVAVIAESGAPTDSVTGRDPWTELLNGVPSYLVMRGFPWERLQALPRDYR